MMNNCSFIGRLVRAPELRHTQRENAVTSFTLAVDRERPNSNGEWIADFLDFVAWGKLAEKACSFVKGDLLAVCGALQVNSYTDNEGKKHNTAQIYCRSIRKLSRPKRDYVPSAPQSASSQSEVSSQGDAPLDDDEEGLPF